MPIDNDLLHFVARLRRHTTLRLDAMKSVDRGPWLDSEFGTLALELFALQFGANSAYRLYCESLGVAPDLVKDWGHIPAVPPAAFKEAELTSIAKADRTAVFHSSGTTGE